MYNLEEIVGTIKMWTNPGKRIYLRFGETSTQTSGRRNKLLGKKTGSTANSIEMIFNKLYSLTNNTVFKRIPCIFDSFHLRARRRDILME